MTILLQNGLRALRTGWRSWVPAVLWMLLIYSASGDGDSVARSSRIIEPLFRWLFPNITMDQLASVHLVARKIAHLTEYAFLAILILYALAKDRGNPRKWFSSAWVLCVAYAATDELHQTFIPGRDGRVSDIFIDSAGAALGILICHFVLLWWGRKPHPALNELAKQTAAPKQHLEPVSPPPPRPTFADQLLCTLDGEDFETHTAVRFAVQERLQREHGGRVLLGRNNAQVQLCLKNTSVSGQHLAFIFRNGQIEIEDLDSSNGTRLNGQRLTPFHPVHVADGDRIEAGEVLLHIRRPA